MTRLPSLTYRQLTTQLQRLGCEFRRQAKGSHEIWWCPEKRRYTTIPRHTGPIDRGTLRKILQDLDIDPNDLNA